MAFITYICLWVFTLTLIGCHMVQLAEGRQLKGQEFTSVKHEVVKPDHVRQAIKITEGQKGHSWVARKKEISPPTAPNGNLAAESSLTEFVNDFRSTTPGCSPRVGHSSAANKANTEAKARGDNSTISHAVEGSLDDLKAREPGHSPGIGHSFQNTKTGPNE